VVAVTWQRVVRKTIDAEVAAGRLSGALPIGLLASGVSALDPGGEPLAAAGVADVGRLVTAATLRQWMAREVWRRQPSTRLRPRVVPDVGTGPLVLTPGPLLWLTVVADRAVLGLGDRLLDLPVEGHDLLAAVLRTSSTFRPDDLGELDDDSRRVVLHRLLAEGVLVHAG
jgi:hypothetical protein